MHKLSLAISLTLCLNVFSFDCISDLDHDGYYSDTDQKISAKNFNECTKRGGIPKESKYRGDCSGSDYLVYPRAPEINDNIDNNCNRKVDEPRFLYSKKVIATNKPQFNQLQIKLVDQRQIDLALQGQLYFRLTIKSLENSNEIIMYPSNRTFEQVTLDIEKEHVISIKQDRLSDSLKFNTPYIISVLLVDLKNKKIGSDADYFYSVTSDNSKVPTKMQQLRSKVTLLALKQFEASEIGEIGTNGSVDIDGTRFGAPKGGTWCDEFYAWTVTQASNEQGFHNMNPDNVPNYFKDPLRDGIWLDKEELIPGDDNSYFDDGRGKWGLSFYDQALGDTTTGSRGDFLLAPHHVAMFFTFDRAQNIVYTIEGNVGNTVQIRKHKTMPGLTNPLNPQTERNYLLGIGRLKEFMFD